MPCADTFYLNFVYLVFLYFLGLSVWLASKLHFLSTWPTIATSFFITGFTALLTEFASNTATANVIVPILVDISNKICLNPIYLCELLNRSCVFGSNVFMFVFYFSHGCHSKLLVRLHATGRHRAQRDREAERRHLCQLHDQGPGYQTSL
jgi:hypothetical protein